MFPLRNRLVRRCAGFRSSATLRLFAVLCAWLGTAGVPAARAAVIPPTTPIAGTSQYDHAHLWWQHMLNIPFDVNPIVDTTGVHAHRGQVGSVLYLAGSFFESSNRTISIGPGTTLFFPIINAFDDNTFYYPNTFTAQELLDNIEMVPIELFVELNGVPLGTTNDWLAHQQRTDPNNPFTAVIQSVDNLYVAFGVDPTLGTGIYPALINPFVVNGFWVGLDPLPPGVHTLRFGGTADFPNLGGLFGQDNLYTIYVTPEPSAVALFGLALSGACAGSIVLRRRRTVTPSSSGGGKSPPLHA